MKSSGQVVLPKILVAAYACEPHAGSEPGVAWSLVGEISQFCEVWVCVAARHQKAIESALPEQTSEFRERVHWLFVDLPQWVLWIKTHVPTGTHFHYSIWQWKTFFLSRRLHRTECFDLSHHMTYGVAWVPPVMSLLDAPFVWGPVGGGDTIPLRLMAKESVMTWFPELLYRVITRVVPRISPLAYVARLRARALLFRVASAESRFPATPDARRIVLCETATQAPTQCLVRHAQRRITVVCAGRMMYGKAYRYALRAFHRFLESGGNGNLIMLGDGPEFGAMRAYCERHGLNEHVQLRGRVSREEVQSELERADVFLHPSFREGGSWSILEAMSLGLPVVCRNASGMADMVDDSSGIRVLSNTPEQYVEQIAEALGRLCNDPATRLALGRGAQRRVETHYLWAQRGRELRDIYARVLSDAGSVAEGQLA